MEIKLNFAKKQIQIIGEVNLQELILQIMDLNLNVEEWSITSDFIYTYPLTSPYNIPYTDSAPTCEPVKIWYNN